MCNKGFGNIGLFNLLLFIGLFTTSVSAIPINAVANYDGIKYPIHVACECIFTLYVDDVYVGQGNKDNYDPRYGGVSQWNDTKKYYPVISENEPKIIAFNGIGGQYPVFPNGFIMDMNDGKDYTKYNEWKCKDFSKTVEKTPPSNWFTYDYDDSNWSVSTSYGANYQNNSFQIFETPRYFITLNAEWLWTETNSDAVIYCRKKNIMTHTLPIPTTPPPTTTHPTTTHTTTTTHTPLTTSVQKPTETHVEKKVHTPVSTTAHTTTTHPPLTTSVPKPVETHIEKKVHTPVSTTTHTTTTTHPPLTTSVPKPVETHIEKKVHTPVSTTTHTTTTHTPLTSSVPKPTETHVEKKVHTPVSTTTHTQPTIVKNYNIVISPHIKIIINKIKRSHSRYNIHISSLLQKIKLYHDDLALYKKILSVRLHLQQHYKTIIQYILHHHLYKYQDQDQHQDHDQDQHQYQDHHKHTRVMQVSPVVKTLRKLNHLITHIENDIQFIKGNHKYILLNILEKLKIMYKKDTYKYLTSSMLGHMKKLSA